MQSWFTKSTLPNIKSYTEFNLIPVGYDNPLFHLQGYADSVSIDTPPELKRGVSVKAIPKDLIAKLNPAKDFKFTVCISVGVKNYKYPVRPLGVILTNDSLRYPENLTQAFLSGGGECIDFGQELLIGSSGLLIPKFTDINILEKLNDALNTVVIDPTKASQFLVGDVNLELVVSVTIDVSDELRKSLREKTIGPFSLPDISCDETPKPTKVSDNDENLLVRTTTEPL